MLQWDTCMCDNFQEWTNPSSASSHAWTARDVAFGCQHRWLVRQHSKSSTVLHQCSWTAPPRFETIAITDSSASTGTFEAGSGRTHLEWETNGSSGHDLESEQTNQVECSAHSWLGAGLHNYVDIATSAKHPPLVAWIVVSAYGVHVEDSIRMENFGCTRLGLWQRTTIYRVAILSRFLSKRGSLWTTHTRSSINKQRSCSQ